MLMTGPFFCNSKTFKNEAFWPSRGISSANFASLLASKVFYAQFFGKSVLDTPQSKTSGRAPAEGACSFQRSCIFQINSFMVHVCCLKNFSCLILIRSSPIKLFANAVRLLKIQEMKLNPP